MTDRDLDRVRAAYPELPDAPPPQATVARLRALYADADAIPDVRNRRRQRPSRRVGLLAVGAVIVSGTAIAGVPASISTQRDVLCLMSTSYQDARTWTITQGRRPRTVGVPAGYGGWSMTCGGLHMVRTTGIQTGTSPDSSDGLILDGLPKRPTLRVVVLVPDGVARVTVRLRHGHSVTVPVRDNVYRYTIRESRPPWGRSGSTPPDAASTTAGTPDVTGALAVGPAYLLVLRSTSVSPPRLSITERNGEVRRPLLRVGSKRPVSGRAVLDRRPDDQAGDCAGRAGARAHGRRMRQWPAAASGWPGGYGLPRSQAPSLGRRGNDRARRLRRGLLRQRRTPHGRHGAPAARHSEPGGRRQPSPSTSPGYQPTRSDSLPWHGIRRVESSGVPPSPGRDNALSSVSRLLLAMRRCARSDD